MAALKPSEPPQYSTDLPDLSVLRLDSPCQYGSSGSGNSHKRPSLTSINSQHPKPKKLCLDDSATTTGAYPFLRRCVPYSFHFPLPVQSSPHSAPAPASASAQEALSSGLGFSSNAFRSAKNAPNSESATPCSAKGSVPPTGCSSLPPRPPRHRPCNSVLASPSGISSNASGLPKNAHNSESATPCLAKGYVPPTGCSSLPPRPPPPLRLKADRTQALEKSFSRTSTSNGYLKMDHRKGRKRNREASELKQLNNGGQVSETEYEETLDVRKERKCLTIHLKCHCGKEYYFLLINGSCFYKLM